MTQLPFRWNLARRQQLGSLLHGSAAEAYRGFFGDLRECCVRVVAAAGDAELVFIGRSPESIFDYLSGALAGTSWSGRAVLVSFSMRYDDPAELARTHPAVLRAIREQLAAQGLAPPDLARGERPTTLVDLVYAGRTFGRLLALLEHWAQEEGTDPHALRRRIRFVGITEQTKNSPNTWRWYQRCDWAARMPRRALRGVSVPYRLWTYLGELQKKVGRWNPPMVWGAEELAHPPRGSDALEALRQAYAIHERARAPAERRRFAAALAARREMRESWLRGLVLELRGR